MVQMSFEWPLEVSYAPEDFIVSGSNASAVAFLEGWGEGEDSAAALISGPPASGKTHLAHVWAHRVGARFIHAAKLGAASSAELWGSARCAVLEGVDAVSDEAALFHLLRHGEAHALHLLLTSSLSASKVPFTLPDLTSRLRSMPSAALAPPDDMLLRAFTVKCFSDYQMRVNDEVVSFLLLRMERSFAQARAVVQRLVKQSADARRDITIPWIKSLPVVL